MDLCSLYFNESKVILAKTANEKNINQGNLHWMQTIRLHVPAYIITDIMLISPGWRDAGLLFGRSTPNEQYS